MFVRKAVPQDWDEIFRIARESGLDYPGMEKDDFRVAEENGRVVGIVGLKRHPECLELCALGVDVARQGQGTGRQLVFELLTGVGEDVYLATVIPGYFERLGFERSAVVPPSMVKNPEWCAGCRRELCTVMVRRSV